MSQQFPPQDPQQPSSTWNDRRLPPTPPPSRRTQVIAWMRRHPVWTAILLVVLVAGGIGSLNDAIHGTSATTTSAPTQAVAAQPTTQPTDTPTPAPTVAFQLATLDTGGTPDSATVARYQVLLDSLHNKTGDSEQAIADETVTGQQLLHNKGKDVKLIDLLTGVDTAVTSKSEHLKYAEALAALITIMENQ